MAFKITSGRKRESAVWMHCTYDAVADKSTCTVPVGDSCCGRKITGKNATNIMNHLKFTHPDVHSEVVKKNRLTSTSKPDNSKPPSTVTNSQQSVEVLMRKPPHWGKDSREALQRDEKLVNLMVRSGVPMRLVHDPDFVDFCKVLDPKYEVPGVTRLNAKVKKAFHVSITAVKQALASARMVTVGMDIWTKKGYSASFLGISASFFHPVLKKALHLVLNLHSVQHPHTGRMIAELLQKTLDEWRIDQRKILMIVTDNGSNMVKAVKEMKTTAASASTNESSGDDSTDEESADDLDTEEIEICEMLCDTSYKRLSCLAHGIQLVVKTMDKSTWFTASMSQARGIVSSIRVSSVATQMLIAKAGKTVIPDCPTRWSSSFLLIRRLLELKGPISEVFEELRWDNLLASEWAKLDDIRAILQPFAEHTNSIQTDVLSLSNVVPVILDLKCHLDDADLNLILCRALQQAMDSRFSKYLDPSDIEFDPLPAAACLLTPNVASALLDPLNHMENLLIGAKRYINSQLVSSYRGAAANEVDVTASIATSSLDIDGPGGGATERDSASSSNSNVSTVTASIGGTHAPPLKKFRLSSI